MKCGAGWRNAVYSTEEPTPPVWWVGCFVDDASRDMKQGPKTYGYTVDSCGKEAKKLGMKYFALQNNGWCVTDNSYSSPASQYPKKPDSECGNKCHGETAQGPVKLCGAGWRNAAYSTEARGEHCLIEGDYDYPGGDLR